MKRPWSPLVLVLALAAAPSVAFADEVATDDGQGESPLPVVSVTISPIHLLFPIFEFTGEYRVMEKLGVAVIAGGGTLTATSLSGDFDVTVIEAGVSPRYYVLGDFGHGMQVGGELTYIGALASDLPEGVSATATGLALGGFIGYKVAADFGLTFDGQLGYQVFVVSGEASSGSTTTTEQESNSGALLNLNVGWSF